MSTFHQSTHWQQCRSRFVLSRHLLGMYYCTQCGLNGQYYALEVDHIRPISDGGPWCDSNNLQLLCVPCHRNKTSLEAKNRSRLKELIQYLQRKRLFDLLGIE